MGISVNFQGSNAPYNPTAPSAIENFADRNQAAIGIGG